LGKAEVCRLTDFLHSQMQVTDSCGL